MPLTAPEQTELYWLEILESLLNIYDSSNEENKKRAMNIARLLDYKLNLAPPVQGIFYVAELDGSTPALSSGYAESFKKALARLEALRSTAE